MDKYKKIFQNVFIVYGQLIISSIIVLLSTKYQIKNLGLSDYGLFNLISGFVVALSFINTALSVSSQRFLSFYMGKDKNRLKNIFTSSLLLHLSIGIIISIILIGIKEHMLTSVFNLLPNEISKGNVVYNTLIISVFFTVVSVPFNGTLLAVENMKMFSLFSILESVFKLLAAVLIIYVDDDRLILYSYYFVIGVGLNFILKFFYCSRYEFVNYSLGNFNYSFLKEMFGFSFWNMFGACASVMKSQGVNVILNIFFGTIINAAYGIANQVQVLFLFISSSLTRAVAPIIARTEGENNRAQMIEYTIFQCRSSLVLMVLLMFPIFCDINYLLGLWIDNVQNEAIIFTQLIFISSVIGSLTTGLQTAIQSVGRIKFYQVSISFTLFLNIPISYFLLNNGFDAYYVFIVGIAVELIAVIHRLIFAKYLVGISILNFVTKILVPFVIYSLCISIWYISVLDKIKEYNILLRLIINFSYILTITILLLCKDIMYFYKKRNNV
jgi:O-antigen/teichoic acid export membrane protein